MEAVVNPTGLELSISVQSRNPGNLIFDGELMQLRSSLISQPSVLKVQVKLSSQCVQQQL